MITIPKDQWMDTVGGVAIHCPGCKKIARLDHTVSKDGVVSPSLVCPFDCGFHEHVRLEGYDS